MDLSKRDPIGIVADERIPREKQKHLSRIINELRSFANVHVFEGGISEDELFKKLQEQKFKLLLAPWYRYLAWNRIEALFGVTRNSGPAFVGYFADQILPYELGEQGDRFRSVLLDFTNLHTPEIITVIKSVLNDNQRSGIRPLLDANAPIYCENWLAGHGQGFRQDTVMSLPEIKSNEWDQRIGALRICLNSLWSLVYEEGPGKSEIAKAQASSTQTSMAYFQLGIGVSTLIMRLCYRMPSFTPKAALNLFWPDAEKTLAPTQLLMKYADFVRLHTISDSPEIELLVGFFKSSPATKAHTQMHTVWVEPIASQLITEIPYEVPGTTSPLLKALPAAPSLDNSVNANQLAEERAQLKAKERFIFHAAVKIRELKKEIAEKEQLVRELRAGGLSTAPQMPPPDAESLLDAFQERFLDSEYQIRKLENQLYAGEAESLSPQELEAIRQKISLLTTREQGWIKKIAETLEQYRSTRKKQEAMK